MSEPGAHMLASMYLGPPAGAPWAWSNDGEAIVYPRGSTIIVREELLQILTRLAPQGLPSASILVLLLGTCREGWRESAEPALGRLLARNVHLELTGLLAETLLALEAIDALPPELRRGPAAKAALVEALLDQAPRALDPAEAASVVAALQEGVRPAAASGSQPGRAYLEEWCADLRALLAGLKALDPASLRRRASTGLADPVRPAELELPDAERARRLLAELSEDRELGGLARLTRHLLATIQVPRPLGAPDDQPVGGYSDIAHRGSPDRLLVSELAYDPLPFAARLAMGEALYLRRESPPQAPPRERVVLLDAGIRLWGVGRVFATAVGLALVAGSDARAVTRVERAQGAGLARVELRTREGLAAHLRALESDPHPGDALRILLAELEAAGASAELIVVTHAETPRDSEFQAALAARGGRRLFLASVDAGGAYALDAYGPRGRKRLGQARLELERLLAPPQAKPRERLRLGSEERPDILRLLPFPFLLPAKVDPERVAHHPRHGTLGVTRDGRLLHWTSIRCGARQLEDDLPRGPVLAMGVEPSGLGWAALHRVGPRKLLLVQVELSEPDGFGCFRVEQETADGLRGAFRLDGLLVLVYAEHLQALSFATGEVLGTFPAPGTEFAWMGGPIFRAWVQPSGWAILSWQDGFRWIPVRDVPVTAVQLWERQGLDGPFALLSDGSVVALDGSGWSGLHRLFPAPDRVLVSRDGHRVATTKGRRGALIDLEHPSPARPRPPGELRRHLEAPALVLTRRRHELRRRLKAIGLDMDGHLVLVSKRGRVARLRQDGQKLVLGPGERGLTVVARRAFLDVQPPPGRRYGLRVATWSSGHRVFVDSRGLLHLLSPHPDDPELSLVVPGQGVVAIWSTHEERSGPEYFHGEPARDAESLLARFQAFVRGIALMGSGA